jgi:hypothetical protein
VRLILAAALAATLAGAPACAGRATSRSHHERPTEGEARETLVAFARALRASRFDVAMPLLSARWRAVYTPGRLALDFRGGGPGAEEAADRVLTALAAGTPFEAGASTLRLPTGSSGEAILVTEGGSWRVDALE